jgi:hypothetical protein
MKPVLNLSRKIGTGWMILGIFVILLLGFFIGIIKVFNGHPKEIKYKADEMTDEELAVAHSYIQALKTNSWKDIAAILQGYKGIDSGNPEVTKLDRRCYNIIIIFTNNGSNSVVFLPLVVNISQNVKGSSECSNEASMNVHFSQDNLAGSGYDKGFFIKLLRPGENYRFQHKICDVGDNDFLYVSVAHIRNVILEQGGLLMDGSTPQVTKVTLP